MNDTNHLHIGVLALQGDVDKHEHQVDLAGATSVQVKTASDLLDIDALIIPGGESTTMNFLLDRFQLRADLLTFCRSRPVWGTCAGMVMLAKDIQDNQAGIQPLGLLDIAVVRNGYGRQVASFEKTITANLQNGNVSLTATFIRAPRITRIGRSVTTLAVYEGASVLVSDRNILASSFHSELDDDATLVDYFLKVFVSPQTGSPSDVTIPRPPPT